MIYIHIPFCKQACHYCDFHFSTSLKYKEEMLHTMQKEIDMRADYLTDKKIQSIYFGGGTPSVLSPAEIDKLIGHVSKHFEIANDAEITIEANPDDLNPQKVKGLRQTAVNRFSIGIQSFFGEDLRWMNRAHNTVEADSAIKRVQDAGFENITADLIYGYPLLTDEKWVANMQKLLDYNIPHISSYSMTVEQKTALAHLITQGKTAPMAEAQSARQMNMLIETLTSNGFEHYEISNFAKQEHYAKHNTSYWRGNHYLGIGPSAHSFNGSSRSWNIANNASYIQKLNTGEIISETEILTLEDQFNEYVMTSLRTMWGISIPYLTERFGNGTVDYINNAVQGFAEKGQLKITSDNHICLTPEGKLIADHIASELFLLNPDS